MTDKQTHTHTHTQKIVLQYGVELIAPLRSGKYCGLESDFLICCAEKPIRFIKDRNEHQNK